MEEMLKKLMEKKKGEGKLPENYKNAKMGVLKNLHKEMGNMIGDDLKGMKGMQKITVAAPDKESLMAGLDKAEDVLEGSEMSEELCPECGMKHEGDEHGEMESSDEDMSVESIDAQIKKLEELKKLKMLG